VALGSTDLDRERIVDVLWFYFGYASYFVLVEDNDWSFAEAEAWLREQASRALGIKPGRRRARGRRAPSSPPAAESR
jgi:hypothetical protein